MREVSVTQLFTFYHNQSESSHSQHLLLSLSTIVKGAIPSMENHIKWQSHFQLET